MEKKCEIKNQDAPIERLAKLAKLNAKLKAKAGKVAFCLQHAAHTRHTNHARNSLQKQGVYCAGQLDLYCCAFIKRARGLPADPGEPQQNDLGRYTADWHGKKLQHIRVGLDDMNVTGVCGTSEHL